MIRSYRIFLNGQEVGSIADGGVLEFEAPAGRNTLLGKIDWARSAPFEITTRAGETVEVEIANRWGALLSLWGITFGMNSYLKFTRKGEQSQPA
jgi:hypothetical protein